MEDAINLCRILSGNPSEAKSTTIYWITYSIHPRVHSYTVKACTLPEAIALVYTDQVLEYSWWPSTSNDPVIHIFQIVSNHPEPLETWYPDDHDLALHTAKAWAIYEVLQTRELLCDFIDEVRVNVPELRETHSL